MTDVENVVVPRGAALVLHHRGRYATGEKLRDDRERILDILGPDTRVLLIGDPDGEVDVHVLDDGARALIDAALALHPPCHYPGGEPWSCVYGHNDEDGIPEGDPVCIACTYDDRYIPWPCPTAVALGVEA